MKKLSSTLSTKTPSQRNIPKKPSHSSTRAKTNHFFFICRTPWSTDLSTSLKLLPRQRELEMPSSMMPSKKSTGRWARYSRPSRKLASMRILLSYSQATTVQRSAHPCPFAQKKGVFTTAAFVSQLSCDGPVIFLREKDALRSQPPSTFFPPLQNSAVVNFHKTKLTAMTSGPS